jgi:hypothetical protein
MDYTFDNLHARRCATEVACLEERSRLQFEGEIAYRIGEMCAARFKAWRRIHLGIWRGPVATESMLLNDTYTRRWQLSWLMRSEESHKRLKLCLHCLLGAILRVHLKQQSHVVQSWSLSLLLQHCKSFGIKLDAFRVCIFSWRVESRDQEAVGVEL